MSTIFHAAIKVTPECIAPETIRFVRIRNRPTLTGPDGVLAHIEALVEAETFDPQDITEITIWTSKEDS